MKFKNSKLKGNHYEEESAKFWAKEMGVEIKPSAGSGRIIGIPGDLMCREECVIKDFVVDVKAVKGLLTQELLGMYNKNKEDANWKPSFLEIYNDTDNGTDNSQPYVFISRRDFARFIRELNGYRKDNKDI